MADDTRLSTNVGTGDLIKTLDDGTRKWCVGVPGMVTTVGDPDTITVPVGSALADDTANPTVYLHGSCILWYDGSTWDRARGNSTDGLLVNLGTNNDVTVTSGTITTVTTITNPVSVTNAALSVIGGGTESTALRVTIASDSTGVLSIDDNGGSVTVDGTVAATQSGTWNIGTVSTVTNVSQLGGQAIAMGTGVRSAGTLRVTIATDDSVPVTGTFWQATQPVSGTVAVSGTVTVASHAVTNAGTFATQIDGTALTRLTDIETNTDSLVVVGNGAAATAQRVTIANDSTGILAGVTTVTTVTTCSTVTTLTGSGVAHDAADSGNPHKIGAKATTSLSGKTLVVDNDRTDLFAGVDGVLVVRNHTNLEDVVQERTTNTDGASTAFTVGLAAPGAGVRLWITSIDISNSSASFCTVDIRDGAAGSVLWTLPVPATGGVCKRFDPPLRLSPNTALAFDASAATSTLSISSNGFKSKV